MGHITVMLKDVPACVQAEFGCTKEQRSTMDEYLEQHNITLLANTINNLGVEIWIPSYITIGVMELGDTVLLCKAGDDTDRIGDGKLWK